MQKKILVFLFIKIFIVSTIANSAEDVTQIFSQGMAAFKADELDKAITTFKSVVKIEPGFVDAHYHLGLSYYRKAKF
ncbi:TPA: tetratricopeptide repeat protein, partial [Candidatus Poribacteria bacterium]|nr:tetratricopeptide repeat protein [Candidatus Poribacteria bacterium]